MIRKSWLLIACIVAGQLVCAVVGALWYASLQESAWSQAVPEHFLSENVLRNAQHANKLARELRLRQPVPPRDEQIAALQEYVADNSLLRREYLYVIDVTGRLIAHPRLPFQPELAQSRPANLILHRSSTAAPLGELLANSPERSVCGWVDMPEGIELVAAHGIGESGLVILTHRRLASLAPLTNSIATDGRRVGLVIAIVLVVLTALITRAVVSRYESRLAVLNSHLEEEVRERSTALLQTRDAVIFGLAKLADSRDRETGEHLERLQQLACLLARELRPGYPETIDEEWIERLRLAAVLHDIGKVGIPDSILLKPGPLSPRERRIMQRHTVIGAECLSAIGSRLGTNDFLAMARDIALCHHEWWNGNGYPRGLRGTQIPLAARIVALADVYDAASSKRVYKDALSHEHVCRLIAAASGTQFDPAVVRAFLVVEESFRRAAVETAGPERPHFVADPLRASSSDSPLVLHA